MLVISAITAVDGICCLECKMPLTQSITDFRNHPKQIEVLGVRYFKTGWNSDRGVVYYKSN